MNESGEGAARSEDNAMHYIDSVYSAVSAGRVFTRVAHCSYETRRRPCNQRILASTRASVSLASGNSIWNFFSSSFSLFPFFLFSFFFLLFLVAPSWIEFPRGLITRATQRFSWRSAAGIQPAWTHARTTLCPPPRLITTWPLILRNGAASGPWFQRTVMPDFRHVFHPVERNRGGGEG